MNCKTGDEPGSRRPRRLDHRSRFWLVAFAWVPWGTPALWGQSPETPLTRLRPIAEPSEVDRFTRQAIPHQSDMVTSQLHTARMQFQLPQGASGNVGPQTTTPYSPSDNSVITPPSLGSSPSPPPFSGTVLGPSTQTVMPTAPPVVTPRGLPMSPGAAAPMTSFPVAPPSVDLIPVSPPQLNDPFATIDNCSCVSPPSSYVAATGWSQCAQPAPYPVATPSSTYLGTPTQVLPAVVIPPTTTIATGRGVPRHSLINFGQSRNPVVVGQGIVGQPVAYVPGQPVRNWIRYLFP